MTGPDAVSIGYPSRDDIAEDYRAIAGSAYATGPKGVIGFATYTDRVEERRGDVYVALGLARALRDLGWGVRLFPRADWDRPPEHHMDVLIAMLPSFIPGKLPTTTATVAWSRNAADEWARQPYLAKYDAHWTSSSLAAQHFAEAIGASATVVPIGVDDELFVTSGAARDIDVSTSLNYWGVERAITPAIAALADQLEVVWVGADLGRGDLSRVTRPGPIDYFAMPALYSRSIVVVDDLTAPSLRFGAHNSRLFESIAAGAVPVTTSAVGLPELGLEAVPVATDAPGLRRVVEGLVADPEATAALARRLRAVVLERHTFAHRARAVDGMLTSLVAQGRARTSPRSLLVTWSAEERAVRNLADRLRAEADAKAAAAQAYIVDPPTRSLLATTARRLVQLLWRPLRRLRRR